MKRSIQVSITILILLSICAIGFWVRMIPAVINPQTGYSFDRAFHLRMVIEVLKTGSVPIVDRLSIYPLGKEIVAQLPVAMYYLTAWFYKFLNFFSQVQASIVCDYFSSLSGALIAIPVFFIALSIYENMILALLAAIIAVLIPAHFRRTFCYWYKYEGIGTLFFCFSLQFFISAIKAKTTFRNCLYGFFAAAFLVLMFSAWRLAILIYVIYFIYATIILLTNKVNKNLEVALSFLVGGVFIGSFFIDYLFVNQFYSSRVFLLSVAVVVTIYIVKYIYDNYLVAKIYMPAINTVIFFAILLILFSFSAPTNYDNFNRLFFIRFAALFGVDIPAEGINKVLLYTQELRTIGFRELFGPEIYSYITALILLYIVYLVLDFKNFFRKEIAGVNVVFLVFFVALFFSSILFFRNKVLASPLLAIIAVGSIIYPIRAIYEKRQESKFIFAVILFVFCSSLFIQFSLDIIVLAFRLIPRMGTFSKAITFVLAHDDFYWVNIHLITCFIVSIFSLFFMIHLWKLRRESWKASVKVFTSVAALSFTLFCAFKTSADVSKMATLTVNKFSPEPKIIDWIRTNTPPNSVLMTYWGQGYTTQLYTGCPTLTDGYLESSEIRDRIMEIETAFYSQNENELYDICAKYHVNYVVLPIYKTQAMAQTANVDYRLYEDWKLQKPTALGEKVTLFKMIYYPNRLRKFKLKFKTDMYRIYEVS